MDTILEDHGTWTCKAKDDAFAREDHAETSIEVNVQPWTEVVYVH